MMRVDPTQRPDVQALLDHPWLAIDEGGAAGGMVG
jgi:hypothetical protein